MTHDPQIPTKRLGLSPYEVPLGASIGQGIGPSHRSHFLGTKDRPKVEAESITVSTHPASEQIGQNSKAWMTGNPVDNLLIGTGWISPGKVQVLEDQRVTLES